MTILLNTFNSKVAAIVIICSVSFGVYFNTLFSGFISDDKYQILQNEWIKNFKYIPRILFSSEWGFAPGQGDYNYYRPVKYLFYIIGYKLSGLEPWGFHIIKILLHTASSLLVFFVAAMLLFEPGQDGRSRREQTPLHRGMMPLFAALVFATHTINTEAVAWVAAIPEVSFTMFFLLSLYLYMKERHVLSCVAFFLSTMSKETAVVLPLIFLAYDIVIKKEPLKKPYYYFKRYLPYVSTVALYLGLRIYSVGEGLVMTRGEEPPLTNYQYLLNIPLLTSEYVGNLLYPVNLTFFNYMRFKPVYSLWETRAIVFFVLSILSVFVLVRFKRTEPVILFAILWIIIPVLPAFYLGWAGGFPVYENRYLYPSSAGFSILVSAIFSRFIYTLRYSNGLCVVFGRRAGGIIVLISMISIIGLYSIGTIKRNYIWKDEYTLWKDVVTKDPENKPARISYGIELARRGSLDEALLEFKMILQMDPYNAGAHNNLGIVYAQKGLLKEAIAEFQEVLAIEPTNMEARKNLEKALHLSNP